MALVAVGGIYVLSRSSTGGTQPAAALTGPALYLDGWSVANLDMHALTLTDSAGGAVPLTWQPVSRADVAHLQKISPQLLRDVAARMITPAAKLRCTTTGCSGPTGLVRGEEFVDATTIPGLGASYQGWGINHTIWEAALPAGLTQGTLTYGTYSMPIIRSIKQATLAPGAAATGADGYFANTWLFAGAFGRLFAPDAQWLAPHPAPFLIGVGLGSVPSAAGDPLVRDSRVYGRGLGVPSPTVAKMTSSSLTYMSSPSTGCGAGVLCVPGAAGSLETKAVTSETSKVCNGSLSALGVFVTADWHYRFDAPTNQFGIWNGQHPAQFANARGADPVFWTGQPPLQSGAVTMHEALVYLLEGSGTTVISLVGNASQVGVDPQSSTTMVAGSADAAKYLGTGWKAC